MKTKYRVEWDIDGKVCYSPWFGSRDTAQELVDDLNEVYGTGTHWVGTSP